MFDVTFGDPLFQAQLVPKRNSFESRNLTVKCTTNEKDTWNLEVHAHLSLTHTRQAKAFLPSKKREPVIWMCCLHDVHPLTVCTLSSSNFK